MFKRRKNAGDKTTAEPKQPSGKPTPSRRARAVIDLHDVTELQTFKGAPVSASMSGQWCALGANWGGRTKTAVPVAGGDKVTATASVVLIEPGAQMHGSRFLFGPVFLDADHNMLKGGWEAFDRPGSQPTAIRVEARAPEAAVFVALGVHGTWDVAGNTDEYVVGFAAARLETFPL